jgi:hypothetical protein
VEKLGDQLTHLEAESSQMKAQLAEMDAQTRQQKSLPTAQQSRSESNNKHSFELEDENASVLRQGKLKIPRSCADLKTIGQPSSGINLIIGAKYIETVLCDFRKQPNDPSKLHFIYTMFGLNNFYLLLRLFCFVVDLPRFPDVYWLC